MGKRKITATVFASRNVYCNTLLVLCDLNHQELFRTLHDIEGMKRIKQWAERSGINLAEKVEEPWILGV